MHAYVSPAVWIGATSGLYLASNASAADGSWSLTQYYGATNVVGVGMSQAGDTLYVTTAAGSAAGGLSAIYSFDIASKSFNNGGSSVMTAPAGYQYRGVAMSPVVPSAAATRTPTSSLTSSNTASLTNTPSATITSSASLSAGATSSQTAAASDTPVSTVTATTTSSQTATATNTPTPAPRSGFGLTGFAAVRIASPLLGYNSSYIPLQTVFIDDYSDCVATGPCARAHTWTVPNSGSGACTLPPNQEAGRLSRSANGALLTWYCVRNNTGTGLGATFISDGAMGSISSTGAISTTFTISKARMFASGTADAGKLVGARDAVKLVHRLHMHVFICSCSHGMPYVHCGKPTCALVPGA